MSRSTETLQARAEILKLARMLQREPDQLAYLEQVPLEALCELRERAMETLWDANSATLSRLAAASRLLPAGLSAALAERTFGALISARLAGQLEPARAVDVAAKLSTPFLADVAIELDPRRARDVIASIPPRRIAEITRELIGRGEYVAMGRFVGYTEDGALRAALGALDNASLLRVGFVLEDKSRLDKLVSMLPDERIGGLIDAAADEGLWLEALDLLGHLSPPRRREIVDSALELDHAALEDIVTAVIEHELWPEVLMIADRDPALQSKLAARIPSLPAEQQAAIAERAEQEGRLESLGALGESLAEVRQRRTTA
jgi:hypothetical protein